MEATGIYSMPVYHALIEHGDFEKVLVCNAGHVKNVPGRKTDMADAEWLCAAAGVRAAGRQLHPPGGGQGGPGRDPLPGQDRPAAGQRDRPPRERAAGRGHQARLRGLVRLHEVGTADDRGADRRGAARRRAGGPGHRQDAAARSRTCRWRWRAGSGSTTPCCAGCTWTTWTTSTACSRSWTRRSRR